MSQYLETLTPEQYVKFDKTFKELGEEVEQWKDEYLQRTGNKPSAAQTCKVVLEKSKLKGEKEFEFSKKSFLETFDKAPFSIHTPLTTQEIGEIIDEYYTPEEKAKLKILYKFKSRIRKSVRKNSPKVSVKTRKSAKSTRKSTKSARKSTKSSKSTRKVSVKTQSVKPRKMRKN